MVACRSDITWEARVRFEPSLRLKTRKLFYLQNA
jgi:hypothetical protein